MPRRRSALGSSELKKTLELTFVRPLRNPDVALDLRLEVFRYPTRRRYYARVWFIESYRLRPTFPQDSRGRPTHASDTNLATLQDSLNFEQCEAGSVAGVVEKVMTIINELFERAS